MSHRKGVVDAMLAEARREGYEEARRQAAGIAETVKPTATSLRGVDIGNPTAIFDWGRALLVKHSLIMMDEIRAMQPIAPADAEKGSEQ